MNTTTTTTMRTTPILIAALLSILVLAVTAAPAAQRTGPDEGTPDRAPSRELAPGDYALGPEDVLEVFVWEEPELSTTVTIRPDGRITLPLAGELPAQDKTPKQLEEEITSRLRRYIDRPLVTVIVKEVHSPKISVLGEVRRPGRFVIPQQTTVLDAIAMSGGFTEFADRKHVLVLRDTPTGMKRISLNVKGLIEDGGRSFHLKPGDTVHVD